jgi:hypothetical protein
MPLPDTARRVERSTDARLNDAIRERTDADVGRFEQASDEEISERLLAMEAEWDVERLLQANASALVLLGVVLGATVDRRFLALPAGVLTFLGQHALQGWCPPLPVFRRLGIRTHREIARERHALKVLRGDFDELPGPEAGADQRARAVLAAIDR